MCDLWRVKRLWCCRVHFNRWINYRLNGGTLLWVNVRNFQIEKIEDRRFLGICIWKGQKKKTAGFLSGRLLSVKLARLAVMGLWWMDVTRLCDVWPVKGCETVMWSVMFAALLQPMSEWYKEKSHTYMGNFTQFSNWSELWINSLPIARYWVTNMDINCCMVIIQQFGPVWQKDLCSSGR